MLGLTINRTDEINYDKHKLFCWAQWSQSTKRNFSLQDKKWERCPQSMGAMLPTALHQKCVINSAVWHYQHNYHHKFYIMLTTLYEAWEDPKTPSLDVWSPNGEQKLPIQSSWSTSDHNQISTFHIYHFKINAYFLFLYESRSRYRNNFEIFTFHIYLAINKQVRGWQVSRPGITLYSNLIARIRLIMLFCLHTWYSQWSIDLYLHISLSVSCIALKSL